MAEKDLENIIDYSYNEIKESRRKSQEALLSWIDMWVPEEEKKVYILAVKATMEPYSKEEYKEKIKDELGLKLS